MPSAQRKRKGRRFGFFRVNNILRGLLAPFGPCRQFTRRQTEQIRWRMDIPFPTSRPHPTSCLHPLPGATQNVLAIPYAARRKSARRWLTVTVSPSTRFYVRSGTPTVRVGNAIGRVQGVRQPLTT